MHLKSIKSHEYSQYFQGTSVNEGKVKEALKVALDTRKFEIELYWKRATYFWAFIAATFAGYFALLASDNIDSYKGFTILVSFIGVMFSLGWYYVNRGSKHWQENWERHVAYLEEKIHGPLFNMVKYSDDKLWQLQKGFPFSVSKVNQLLSLIVLVFWLFIFVYSVFFSFDKVLYINDIYKNVPNIIPILISISIIIPIVLFTKYSFSFLIKEKNKIDIQSTEEEIEFDKNRIKFVKRE